VFKYFHPFLSTLTSFEKKTQKIGPKAQTDALNDGFGRLEPSVRATSKVTKSEKTRCQHFSFRAQHITIVQGSDSALHFQQSFCPTIYVAWATYKTLLVYLASIKASASYHQIFVEFNQNCETTVETYIQTWTITTTLIHLTPVHFCMFLQFLMPELKLDKHGGSVSVHIRMQKYQCNFFGWI